MMHVGTYLLTLLSLYELDLLKSNFLFLCKIFSPFYITKIMGAKCMKKSPSTSTAIFCGFMVGNMRSQKLLQEIFISWFLFLECSSIFVNNKMVSESGVAPSILNGK